MVDGSTSKALHRIDAEMSNGRLCMKAVCRCVASLPHDTDVAGFCRAATQAVRDEYARCKTDISYLAANPSERATASAVVYSAARGEVWLVGDCQCLADTAFYDNPKPAEAALAAIRSEAVRQALDNGCTVDDIMNDDPGRRIITPKLKAACAGQNTEYAVIDGFDIPLNLVKVVDVSACHEIELASDGYPKLMPTLKQSEEQLEMLLRLDPLCISLYKATKGIRRGASSFDDRSYVRIKV